MCFYSDNILEIRTLTIFFRGYISKGQNKYDITPKATTKKIAKTMMKALVSHKKIEQDNILYQ
jgi:hypothetical protein